MNVTIYSDATFSPKSKKGAWAFSLVCNTYRFAKHGKIPNNRIYTSIHYCEMYAVCKGVLTALKIPDVKTVTVKTDSQTVIKFFNGYPPSCRDDLMTLCQGLIKTVKAMDVTLNIRHVKAHVNDDTTASYMNRSVDRLAKKALK
jgi:ribonuclease HI